MKMKLNLFAGSYTLTVYNDGNFSATSASPSSSLAKDDVSTLTITANSNYELDDIEVISGGCTIQDDSGTKKVKMGDASAVIFIKGKKSNNYMVTEETMIDINGTRTVLHANTTVQLTLYNYKGQFSSSYNLLFADIIIITIPMLILFLLFNKKIVAGMVAGSVKG